MPKKKLYLQISFEQGMVDTIVSDYDYQDSNLKWQAPQSRSAVFIKNYDPTIVRGALTKRYGFALLRTAYELNEDMGLVDIASYGDPFTATYRGVPNGYDSTNINNVDLSKYTLLIDVDPDPTTGLTTGQDDPLTVCGATVVPYNKPFGQNVLVYFLRDISNTNPKIEYTRIVHFGAHTATGTGSTPRWYNSHIDGAVASGSLRTAVSPSVYPGWQLRGTFTDASRHGGSLIVTTNVATQYYPWITGLLTGTTFSWSYSWVNDLYPSYVWSYWDLRRKRDNRKFWQVIGDGSNTVTVLSDLTSNYTADDKYSQFKVLYPSMRITRDTTFVSWRAYSTTYVDPFTGAQSVVLTNASAASGGDLEHARALDNVNDSVLSASPINSAIEVAIIEFRGRSYNTTPITYVNNNNPFTDKLSVASQYTWLNEYLNHIPTCEIPKTYEIASADNQYWKAADYVDVSLTNPVINNIEVVNGVLSISSKQRVTNIIGRTLTSTLANQTTDIVIGNGKSGDDQKLLKDESAYWVVGVKLPNYLESNAPRPWLKGEKIPLLLTATIRGAEIVISEHTHIVSTDDYKPYPSMWWPAPAYYATAYGSVIGPNTYIWGSLGVLTTDEKTSDEIRIEGPMPNRTTITEQYYLALGQTQRFNGKLMVVAMVRGYALAISGTASAAGNDIKYRLYETHEPYCIEPFNPTSNKPYVADTADYAHITNTFENQLIFHRPVSMLSNPFLGASPISKKDNNVCGYRKEHINPKLIMLTIKIAKTRLAEVLEQGIESLNIYCAQPSDVSAFESIGLYNIEDPQAGIYMLPDVPEPYEYNKYRLVKRYVLDGDGSPYHDFRNATDNTYWKNYYNGSPIATNSWVEKGPNANTGFIIATGQHDTNDINGNSASTYLTPDFILWDYPVSTTLSLNSSGKYYQGRGANMVTSIKGRTFLGGCIDKYGEEEQAIIRYSDVQSGVITTDVFSEENFIRVGGLPHKAFIEYREHLWVFSRSECHRIQMPDVVNTSTWEYLDKIPGQGTFNQKTVITTPHGVIWANEGGVWLSDGRMPENLAQQVLTFYKAMATNNPPYYATKINLPSFPYDEEGINPYLEVAYDEFKNELVICSPIATFIGQTDFRKDAYQQISEEYRLVYSFDNKVWHVQHADLPLFNTYLNEFDAERKITF